MRLGLGAEIGEIDVAVFETAHRNDAEAGHYGAGRVGSVGGSRNETNVTVRLAARRVVTADGEQAGVLAL